MRTTSTLARGVRREDAVLYQRFGIEGEQTATIRNCDISSEHTVGHHHITLKQVDPATEAGGVLPEDARFHRRGRATNEDAAAHCLVWKAPEM